MDRSTRHKTAISYSCHPLHCESDLHRVSQYLARFSPHPFFLQHLSPACHHGRSLFGLRSHGLAAHLWAHAQPPALLVAQLSSWKDVNSFCRTLLFAYSRCDSTDATLNIRSSFSTLIQSSCIHFVCCLLRSGLHQHRREGRVLARQVAHGASGQSQRSSVGAGQGGGRTSKRSRSGSLGSRRGT